MSFRVFRHEVRVHYALCTLGNHVYYSRYLDLLEIARNEFFRHLGIPFLSLQEQGLIFPVVECRVRYKRPARYDDLLTIEVQVAEAARIRLRLACRVLDATGRVLVEAETFHVCTGLDDKPARLPDPLLAALHPYSSAAHDSNELPEPR